MVEVTSQIWGDKLKIPEAIKVIDPFKGQSGLFGRIFLLFLLVVLFCVTFYLNEMFSLFLVLLLLNCLLMHYFCFHGFLPGT